MDISYKNICHITFPVLVSMLVEQLIGITDTAFLGHVGEVELGASAIAGVCFLILYVTGSGFGIGLQVLIARLNGEKNRSEIVSVFSIGLYFLVAFSLSVIVFFKWFLPYLLGWIIKSDNIYKAACDYLDWRVYGLLFSFIIIAFRAYYIGIIKTKFLTFSSIVMVAVNIVLDYVLIFGECGFPKLGIKGAAIASCIAELVVALLFFIYYSYTHKNHKFDRIQSFKKLWLYLKRILKLSIWTMLQSFLSLASWLVFFVVIEHLGKEPLAISNIVRSISSVPFMFALAFSSTGSSLISNLIGEGREDIVLKLCRKIVTICFIFCIPLLLIITVIPNLTLMIYTKDPTLINNSLLTLYVMLSSYILTIPSSVYYCAISGTGNTYITLKYGIITLFIYVLYIVLIAHFTHNVALLWTSEHVNSLALLLFSYIYMRRGTWQHKKI